MITRGGSCCTVCPVVPGIAAVLQQLDAGDRVMFSSEALGGAPIEATFTDWDCASNVVSFVDGIYNILVDGEFLDIIAFDSAIVPQCELHGIGRPTSGE